MPVMDGLSAIRELRVLEGAKAVLHRYVRICSEDLAVAS